MIKLRISITLNKQNQDHHNLNSDLPPPPSTHLVESDYLHKLPWKNACQSVSRNWIFSKLVDHLSANICIDIKKYLYLAVCIIFPLPPLSLYLPPSLSLLSINAMIEIKLMHANEMKNVLHAKSVSYQKRSGA